jgi:hypothetical protein
MRTTTFVVAGLTLACALAAGAVAKTIYGTAGSNVILGTRAADTIYARGGGDTVYARSGNDLVYAGPGADTVYGGRGRDRLYGGVGNDRIYAADASFDRIYCGRGWDRAKVNVFDAVSRCERVIQVAGDRGPGIFIIKCGFSHRAQVDPIVVPGPKGTLSGHMHDFFGNRSTDSDSTYASMTAAGTTCGVLADTAGYWAPTLYRPDGTPDTAQTAFAYYLNRPTAYSNTVSFPPNFKMIAGGVGTFPEHTWWNCFNQDSATTRFDSPPSCADSDLELHLKFPNCWDGVNLDSADHRGHVVYPAGKACPADHPVKLPSIFFFLRYSPPAGGTGWYLSDGTTLPHADFWNTWSPQSKLEQLVRDCLNAGVECGRVTH